MATASRTSMEYTRYDESPIVDVHIHPCPIDINKEFEFPQVGPEVDTENIEKLGIKTTVLSPIIFSMMLNQWPSEKYTRYCQRMTLWQAELVAKSPTTRGSFAPLPVQDVDECLKALQWCENEVYPKPDGYALGTTVRNLYFGNPYWDPIWEALNAVSAVLFIHPNETIVPENLEKDRFLFTTVEYPQETARTIMEMIEMGVFTRYPRIRWIFAHNGGTFPYIFQRIARSFSKGLSIGWGGPANKDTQHDRIGETNQGRTIQEIFSQGNIYFEGAQGTPSQHAVIRSLGVGSSNLLCGSDLPFSVHKEDFELTYRELRQAERSLLYGPREIKDIYYGNALRLFPRLTSEWAKDESLKMYVSQ